MSDNKLALYFGCVGTLGHYLNLTSGERSTDTQRLVPGFPWHPRLCDSGLLENAKVPDRPDGRVYWTCGGATDFWHAFYWWDRSGDKRPNSNSGFYVRGFDGPPEDARANLRAAFEFACDAWPAVVARQHHALVLVNLEGEPEP